MGAVRRWRFGFGEPFGCGVLVHTVWYVTCDGPEYRRIWWLLAPILSLVKTWLGDVSLEWLGSIERNVAMDGNGERCRARPRKVSLACWVKTTCISSTLLKVTLGWNSADYGSIIALLTHWPIIMWTLICLDWCRDCVCGVSVLLRLCT